MRTALGGSTGALGLMAALGFGAGGCSGAALGSPHDAALGSPADGGVLSATDGAAICGQNGCDDQFTATVTVDFTKVASGTHTLTVAVDGQAGSCTFAFPPAADFFNEPCGTGVHLSVARAETCTTTQMGTVTATDCVPIGNDFWETIMVQGSPPSLEVQQLIGGTVILDQTLSPMYQIDEPNGPGCSPICYQESVDWTIPPRSPS